MPPTSPPPVPLCDVVAQYRALKDRIDAAVLRVLESGQSILGPEVAAFEAEAAGYLGVPHAVGCADGSTALLLALKALDVGPGDEVVVPAFTFFATAGAVVRAGATPVFADVDPLTFNLDPARLEAAVGPRTRAVVPVHLFGQAADMGGVWDVADRHGLYVVEDAAQAFGADYQGRMCGGLGAVGCFSFYPSKNLGGAGDGGLVTTANPDLARKLAALRVHGSEERYYHKYVGWNARLDAVQAAVLRVKLPHVDGWNDARRAAAGRYDELIEAAGLHGFLTRPHVRPHGRHTFNQYVVRCPAGHRDHVVRHLKADGVGCEVYYPLGLHQQECLAGLGYRAGDFPATEEAARTVLALPMFPGITEAQQHRAVSSLAAYVHRQLTRAA